MCWEDAQQLLAQRTAFDLPQFQASSAYSPSKNTDLAVKSMEKQEVDRKSMSLGKWA